MAAIETGAWLGCDRFGIDQMMVSNPVQFFGGGGADAGAGETSVAGTAGAGG